MAVPTATKPGQLSAKRAQGAKLGNPRNIRSAGQLGRTALIASSDEFATPHYAEHDSLITECRSLDDQFHEAYQLHLQVQRRNTTVILMVLARFGPRKERGHLQDHHSSCGAVNIIRIKETLVCLPMDREGYHIGGQSCYRALSSLLRASGSLHPSVKSNDCWNRMASAVEPAAGTVPSI